MIRALGIDPELEHAARRVEGAGDDALALELAHVADVDELHVVAAVQLLRFFHAVGGDDAHRVIDHRLDRLLHYITVCE